MHNERVRKRGIIQDRQSLSALQKKFQVHQSCDSEHKAAAVSEQCKRENVQERDSVLLQFLALMSCPIWASLSAVFLTWKGKIVL